MSANEDASTANDVIQYSREAVLLVILVLVLLSLLFYLLLSWSRTRDMASYYGEVYKETVENWEYRQILAPYKEKWDRREYYAEAVRNMEKARPEPSPDLLRCAEDLGPQYRNQIERLRSRQTYRLRGGPGLIDNGFDDPWEGPQQVIQDPNKNPEDDSNKIKKEFYSLLNLWITDLKKWDEEINKKVNDAYAKDLNYVKEKAAKRAKRATSEMDLSALRGRGAEFVLEFTAVVVIIFAAVILGILGILKEQHIGTLLAAIAGYVLGKATSEKRGSGNEERSRDSAPNGVTTPDSGNAKGGA
ncbi:preprotein translocase subunit SecG [Catalinimonas alkaloidigena]|uniref:hypothetical protein n=1 Tax=Catalinimonas alkaloidigena TaxID=1075417 RepID=UPI00240689F8|nr:hypothetical protein [Catalinimonas alkaloidigena]MDF9798140.1 preprotein translocase subunit SecG [Catalinimonas alkaloidigena]